MSPAVPDSDPVAFGKWVRTMLLAVLGVEEVTPEPGEAVSGKIIITPQEGETQEDQNG
jgi:hypothetical protein